ncbi:ABC-type transport auxiliary lipoprotein family protein [Rhizorhapis suberifaciens]|uniref:Cholesterol transport system auxiliary component n=1 Tax=Rhizorhapis suberifaciens TaxID=13656 RepID=A0A840HU86_9SPHN|nr:ABC-type transport auxiliary lipoprotein family protein [Rhizorhapis suberifaciens]MBB4641066.1 cholesterol transport system auxiliary component [Rhizorhapis suberifaciens]
MRRLLLLLLTMPVAACVNFGAKPPERLLSLSAKASLDGGTLRTGATGNSLIVGFPETPRMLETSRVPVQIDDVSVAYLKGGQWVDQPGRLFQRLLSEVISAKTNRVILDPGLFGGEPATRLSGELLRFGVDARSRQALVTYDATLLGSDGSTVTKKRFSATRPVSEIDAVPVGGALNDAANDVADQVAQWVAQ